MKNKIVAVEKDTKYTRELVSQIGLLFPEIYRLSEHVPNQSFQIDIDVLST